MPQSINNNLDRFCYLIAGNELDLVNEEEGRVDTRGFFARYNEKEEDIDEQTEKMGI